MLLKGKCTVECHSKIDFVGVVFQFFSVPLDVQFIVSLVVVEVEGTYLGLGRVCVEGVLVVIF